MHAVKYRYVSRLTLMLYLPTEVGEQSLGDGGLLELPRSMAEEEEDRQSTSTPPLFACVATTA